MNRSVVFVWIVFSNCSSFWHIKFWIFLKNKETNWSILAAWKLRQRQAAPFVEEDGLKLTRCSLGRRHDESLKISGSNYGHFCRRWLGWTSTFSRMRSEGSRFTLGSGGEAVFAESCICVRNRSQPSATVPNGPRDRRKALLNGECIWTGLRSESSELATLQLYWRLQGRCLCVMPKCSQKCGVRVSDKSVKQDSPTRCQESVPHKSVK